MGEDRLPQVRGVLLASRNVDRVVETLARLGVGTVRFRDHDKYVVLAPDQPLTVAVKTPDDHPSPEDVVVTVKVASVRDEAARLAASGLQTVTTPHQGAHEWRALMRTEDGLALSLYGEE